MIIKFLPLGVRKHHTCTVKHPAIEYHFNNIQKNYLKYSSTLYIQPVGTGDERLDSSWFSWYSSFPMSVVKLNQTNYYKFTVPIRLLKQSEIVVKLKPKPRNCLITFETHKNHTAKCICLLFSNLALFCCRCVLITELRPSVLGLTCMWPTKRKCQKDLTCRYDLQRNSPI